MTHEALLDGPVAALVAALATGAVGPSEVTEAVLERIEERDPSIGAFVYVGAEAARRQARALGRPGGRPLFGVPMGVKDVIDVEGMPTEAGSRLLGGNIASTDATVVASMRAAGAVIVGKTTTHELAFGATTPATRNPRVADLVAGGSSGGSAAAVATGMVAAAIGTDTAGSIRIPAALCGVCGLRPRHGLLAMAGVVPLAPSFDTVGPITRRAGDLPLILHALGGGQLPPPRSCAPRLGVLSSDALGEVDPEIAAIVDAAVGALRDDGAEVVAVTGPRFDLSPRTRAIRLLSEAVAGHRAVKWFPDRVEQYGPQLRFHLAYASGLTPRDIAAADRELARFTSSLRTALRSVDVLALPTVPVTPPALAAAIAAEKIEGPDRVTPQITRLVAPLGFAGVAAVTVPCGTARSGCPVGLQLAGEDEGRVLAVAERYELIRS